MSTHFRQYSIFLAVAMYFPFLSVLCEFFCNASLGSEHGIIIRVPFSTNPLVMDISSRIGMQGAIAGGILLSSHGYSVGIYFINICSVGFFAVSLLHTLSLWSHIGYLFVWGFFVGVYCMDVLFLLATFYFLLVWFLCLIAYQPL